MNQKIQYYTKYFKSKMIWIHYDEKDIKNKLKILIIKNLKILFLVLCEIKL